jgi:hypothetical protein
MVSAPARWPRAVGLNVTLTVQDLPTGNATTPARQVLVCAKSPVVVMAAMLSGAAPVLVKVTGWAGLRVPTLWVPKTTLEALRVTAAQLIG